MRTTRSSFQPGPRRPTRRSWRRSRRSFVPDRARFERDGNVGVVVIDDPPLNLFGSELSAAVVEALGVAEGAGPARARELVMSGGLYPAETLERWNVINRVLPDDELLQKTMRFAERLAAGPTVANAATKRVVRSVLDEGVRGADARM